MLHLAFYSLICDLFVIAVDHAISTALLCRVPECSGFDDVISVKFNIQWKVTVMITDTGFAINSYFVLWKRRVW